MLRQAPSVHWSPAEQMHDSFQILVGPDAQVLVRIANSPKLNIMRESLFNSDMVIGPETEYLLF